MICNLELEMVNPADNYQAATAIQAIQRDNLALLVYSGRGADIVIGLVR
jgi:hypothetical protein